MGSCQSNDDFPETLGDGTLNVKLTEEDIRLIKSSWGMIKDPSEMGLSIMMR